MVVNHAAAALQQPEGARGADARREPGGDPRGAWAFRPTCASPSTARPLFMCGAPNETAAGAETYRQGRTPRQGQGAARGGRLQGREDRVPAAHRRHAVDGRADSASSTIKKAGAEPRRAGDGPVLGAGARLAKKRRRQRTAAGTCTSRPRRTPTSTRRSPTPGTLVVARATWCRVGRATPRSTNCAAPGSSEAMPPSASSWWTTCQTPLL